LRERERERERERTRTRERESTRERENEREKERGKREERERNERGKREREREERERERERGKRERERERERESSKARESERARDTPHACLGLDNFDGLWLRCTPKAKESIVAAGCIHVRLIDFPLERRRGAAPVASTNAIAKSCTSTLLLASLASGRDHTYLGRIRGQRPQLAFSMPIHDTTAHAPGCGTLVNLAGMQRKSAT
jgi:hypothetical protein